MGLPRTKRRPQAALTLDGQALPEPESIDVQPTPGGRTHITAAWRLDAASEDLSWQIEAALNPAPARHGHHEKRTANGGVVHVADETTDGPPVLETSSARFEINYLVPNAARRERTPDGDLVLALVVDVSPITEEAA